MCLSVIYNYDGHSEHHLQLTVGDTIQIKEQFGGTTIFICTVFTV